MGDLSRNFSRKEFACRCGCGFDAVSPRLVRVLQSIRDEWGKAMVITSGCRCVPHNARVGGAKASDHLRGEGADVAIFDAAERDRFVKFVLKRYEEGKLPDLDSLGWKSYHNGCVHIGASANPGKLRTW